MRMMRNVIFTFKPFERKMP